MQTEINGNEISARKVFQQRKPRKDNNLNYKPKSADQIRVQEKEDVQH